MTQKKRSGPKPRPAIHRVLEKVEVQPDGCWIVRGIRPTPSGYIPIRIVARGEMGYAHRISYAFFHGDIPEGYDIDHTCHGRSDCKGGITCVHRGCVNPHHLEAVTRSVNVSRGRTGQDARDRAAARTHCKNGHAYTPENEFYVRNGASTRRRCRTCCKAWRGAYESRTSA